MLSTLRRWLPLWILLAVCVGGAIVGSLIWPRAIDEHPVTSARCRVVSDIVAIDSALADYAASHDGTYPPTLAELFEPDAGGRTYLTGARAPRDPWNREYRYQRPGPKNAQPVVGTLGRDGLVGGDDDDRDVDSITVMDDPYPSSSPR